MKRPPIARAWRRLRHWFLVRAAVRRADQVMARCRHRRNPGYDELRDPWFMGVMALAVAVLAFDLVTDGGMRDVRAVVHGWVEAATAAPAEPTSSPTFITQVEEYSQ